MFFANTAHSQHLAKKVFKDAKTIRLYVNDATPTAAVERFTRFINKTAWTVETPTTKRTEINTNQNDNTGVQDLAQPISSLETSQSVDTIMTDTGTLHDFMMGAYQGELKFYADSDNSDKLYIAVSAYVSSTSWGGFNNLKMKKGGKDSNWAQRAMFKQLNNHLLSYPEVNQIMYSDK